MHDELSECNPKRPDQRGISQDLRTVMIPGLVSPIFLILVFLWRLRNVGRVAFDGSHLLFAAHLVLESTFNFGYPAQGMRGGNLGNLGNLGN